MQRRSLTTLVVLSLTFGAPVPQIWAVGSSGLSAQFVGVKALGLSNAFVAQVDDPSANYFNPAGLVQLDRWQTMLGISSLNLKSKRHSSLGNESMERNPADLPHLFVTGPLKRADDSASGHWAFGLGVTTPFGLTTEWNKDGFARYVATKSTLETLHYNPSVAYAFDSKLSVGAGLDYLDVMEVSLESQINQAAIDGPGTPDGRSQLEGDGGEFGYNAGVLWKPIPNHSFGFSYRSQFRVNIKGDLKFSGLTGSLESVFSGSDYTTSVETDLPFPQSAMLGYYYLAPSKKWTLLFDYEWTDWSIYKRTDLTFKESDPTRSSVLDAANHIDRSWEDTHAVAVGSEYFFNNGIALRLGYAYIPTAVPNRTWEPSVPDANQHVLGNGLGYSWTNWTVDFAYNIILYNNRTIDNTVGNTSGASVNGKYKTLIDVIALSGTYRFGAPRQKS